MIEFLESRIAPAALFSFTDVDGDLVTITSSKGKGAPFSYSGQNTGSGYQLFALTLHDPAFEGADIGTTVRKVEGGDGLVNIGFLNASGRDLGKVTIKGDLGRIFVGNGADPDPAVKLLSVFSMGERGLATQGNAGDLKSVFNGDLVALKVTGKIQGAEIKVGSLAVDGAKIGSVTVGGSIQGGLNDNGGTISASAIGRVAVGGDLAGGGGEGSGRIDRATSIGSITIKGALRGGPGEFSGRISGPHSLGPITIGSQVIGGGGAFSGTIEPKAHSDRWPSAQT